MKKTNSNIGIIAPKKILITLGILFIVGIIGTFVVYAANQGKLSYRSVHGSTTVGSENSTASFNNDQVEEHGMCFTVINSCSNDVFIPTKTTGEMLAFSGGKPACTQLDNCGCVLKQFVNGVWNGTIQYSKFRNDLNGFVNNQGTGGVGYGNFVLGYGEVSPINVISDILYFPGRVRIASQPIISYDYNSLYGVTGEIHEFELYGISPDTENINRGCFSDGSYRVNSNVYSRQLLLINESSSANIYRPNFTTSRFHGLTGANFGLKLNINGLNSSPEYRYNRFFGCRSDLLPNPDKYCVERVIPKDGTVPDSKPSAIYIKEFTNNYSFAGCGSGDACYSNRISICSNLTGLANSTFRIMQNTDIGGTGGIYDMIRPYYEDSIGGGYGVGGTYNNNYFYYRNTTGSNSGANYSTQIFGFYVYNGIPNNYDYIIPSNGYLNAVYDNSYYYYSNDEIGSPGNPHHTLGHQDMMGYHSRDPNDLAYIKIPLLTNDSYLIYEAIADIYSSYTGSASLMGSYPQLSKYICVSHSCNAGYVKTSTGCICPPGGCGDSGGGEITLPY